MNGRKIKAFAWHLWPLFREGSLSCHIHFAVRRDLGFLGLINRTALVIALYDKQGESRTFSYPGSYRIESTIEFGKLADLMNKTDPVGLS